MDLLQTLGSEGPVIRLDIAEDFSTATPTQLQLRLRLNEWVDDEVQVWWDGEALTAATVTYCRLDNANPPGGAFQPIPRWRELADVSSAVWLSWDFDPTAISEGEHSIRVVLEQRNKSLGVPLTLTDVELVVRY